VGAISQFLAARAQWTKGGNPREPQYWVKKLFGVGVDTDSGVQIDEDVALRYSAVWRAVNLIAGTISYLSLPVYERQDDGRQRRPEHPIYTLIHDRPNPYMDSQTCRETLQGHALTWGNGYAEIERNGAGRAIGLWPLRPDRVTPEITDDGVVHYKVRLKSGGTAHVFYDDMLHIKGLGFDGLRGYPVIEYAARELGLGIAATKFGAKFFANNARPGGVLKHPGTLTDDALARLKKQWAEKYQGLDNAHRVAVLADGMEWQATGIPPEDAQYIETRKFEVTDVARWFGVPPHLLGELDRATFSNIEHQQIEFVIYTLLAWARRWENEANYKLFSAKERQKLFCEFLFDTVMRGDTKTRFEAYRIAVNTGWMSRNEVRQRENLNPADGLDEFLEPLNMKPASMPWPEPQVKGLPTRQLIAVRDLFESTWARIVTKEVNALRTALKKPATFRSRVERLYTDLTEHICKVLAPVAAVYGNTLRVKDVADSYVQRHRSQLIDEVDRDGDNPADTVEPMLAHWQQTESIDMANRICGGPTHAISELS